MYSFQHSFKFGPLNLKDIKSQFTAFYQNFLCPNTNWLNKTFLVKRALGNSYFSSCQFIAEDNICRKCQNRDQHRRGGPENHTEGIQVFSALETSQLIISCILDAVHKVLLP